MLDFLDKESQSEFEIILDLFNKKKIIESELRLKKLILKYPDKFLLENFLGVIFSNQNKYQEALLSFKKALDLKPEFAEGHYNIGTVFKKNNQFLEAIKHLNLAVNMNQNYFEAYFNLGDCYKNINKFKDAEKCFLKCISLNKDDVEIYNNLGLLYLENSKLDFAETNFKKCLELNSNYFYAYHNLGLIFSKLKNYEKAIVYFNKAIEFNIGFAPSYNNLGKIFNKQNKKSIAIHFFSKAINLDNKFYDAYLNLIQTLKDDFKYYEVIKLSKQILSFNSKDSPRVIGNCISIIAQCYVEVGEFEKGFAMHEHAINIYEDNPIIFKNYILQYNYSQKFNLEKHFEIINKYIGTLKVINKNFLNDFTYKKNSKKIRIGFVSGDLREHAVGFQVFGIIEELFKRQEFELFAYYNDDVKDSLNIKFRSIFDFWNDIKDLKDIDLVNKIRVDGIHILVDLSGFTAKNRLEIFFQRSAPIQVTWAGYLSSTGLKQMDYIITDPYVTGKKKQFVEKICQQDYIWSILSCVENVAIIRDTPATINHYITFGSFNNLVKINPDLIYMWSQILYQVKNSKLYLKNSSFRDEKIKRNYQELFLKNNIKLEQLIFEIDTDRKKLFEDYNKIDIALDTFPYTGGTTSLEASWMCVPILTKSGDIFLSRCGESINMNLGLKEWICKSSDEYIKKAIDFSSDLRKLQLTRDILISNRDNNILFNSKKFAENLSISFKKTWKNFNV